MDPDELEDSPDISIRPYQRADRSAVYRIAGDTAFFGAPVEAFLEDRRVFLDSFYRYYTDFEPENAWVAVLDGEVGDEVVGFLTGCLDTTRQQNIFTRRLVPDALWGVLTGRYRLGPKTWRYVWRLSREAMSGGLPKIDLQTFPAHLHINVDAAWRGRGLGRRLLLAFLEQLRLEGIPGVHLETTSQNAVACRLYERLGFRLASSHPTRLWKGWIDDSVENRVYTLGLEKFHDIMRPGVERPSAG